VVGSLAIATRQRKIEFGADPPGFALHALLDGELASPRPARELEPAVDKSITNSLAFEGRLDARTHRPYAFEADYVVRASAPADSPS